MNHSASTMAVLSLAASMSLFGTARAYTLSPQGAFTGSGTIVFQNGTYSTSCVVHIGGNINARGVGLIRNFRLVSSKHRCPSMTSDGLPWGFRATGPQSAAVDGFSVSGGKVGACGPARATATILGPILFNKTQVGPCVVQGYLTVSPSLSIIP